MIVSLFKWLRRIAVVLAAAVAIVLAVNWPSSVAARHYQSLANAHFKPGNVKALKTLDCGIILFRFVHPQMFGPLSMHVVCSIQSTCGVPIRHQFFASPLGLSFTGPDPFVDDFARQCPKMLKPEVLEKVSLDRGG